MEILTSIWSFIQNHDGCHDTQFAFHHYASKSGKAKVIWSVYCYLYDWNYYSWLLVQCIPIFVYMKGK